MEQGVAGQIQGMCEQSGLLESVPICFQAWLWGSNALIIMLDDWSLEMDKSVALLVSWISLQLLTPSIVVLFWTAFRCWNCSIVVSVLCQRYV